MSKIGHCDSRLGEYTSILGICATVNCPLCMTMRRFRLLHVNDGLTKGGFHALSCEVCGSTHDIPPGAVAGAREAMELYESLQRKEINAAEYRDELSMLEFFDFLKVIHTEGSTWICDACQEKCPENFADCWNCHAMRPGVEDMPVEDGTPHLPETSRVKKPHMPWEE